MIDYDDLAIQLMNVVSNQKYFKPERQMDSIVRGEMGVLFLLSEKVQSCGIAAGEISRRLHMTTSRISAVLNSLERKQLIVRRTDDADKRRVLVSLTETGTAFCHAKQTHMRERTTHFLMQMGERDACEFVRLIGRAAQLMSQNCENEADDMLCDQTKNEPMEV